MTIPYEIDFLAVWEESHWGDAIILRYGDFSNRNNYRLVVIDGGHTSTWTAVINHIKKYYGDTYIDLVVATHLHADHTAGLLPILEEMKVLKLAMHLPWDYPSEIKKMCEWQHTVKYISEKIEKSVATISELEDIARKKWVEIIQPFQGAEILEGLRVFWPSREYYTQLVAHFNKVPFEVKDDFFLKELVEEVAEVFSHTDLVQHITAWGTLMDMITETLSDNSEDTDHENNSSMVLMFHPNQDERILFTGDAGKWALNQVLEYADSVKCDLTWLAILDVPHHGSKRNLSRSILDTLMPKKAFISCPKKSEKHPSGKIINALKRRWCKVYKTAWVNICQVWGGHVNDRADYSAITEVDFHPEFEE